MKTLFLAMIMTAIVIASYFGAPMAAKQRQTTTRR